MSTTSSNLQLEAALNAIPKNFRTKILETYVDVKRRHMEGEFDAAGLSAGKFCEAVLRFLQDHITQKFVPFGTKIQNFSDACLLIEKTPRDQAPESLRLVIPRALTFLYTIRNKRGIGHVGGDVEANKIDSATMARISDWIVCELIRVFHKLSLEEAQAIVDALSIRELPTVWGVAGKKRILKPGLNYGQQVLLLCYSESEAGGLLAEDVFTWVEHSNYAVFKRDVLKSLHKRRLIEFDQDTDTVHISPIGAKEVEEVILKL